MATSFEPEIRALLTEHRDPAKVAEELVRRWNLRVLGEDERKTVAEFLVNAGLFPTFFEVVSSLVPANERLPWAVLGEAIGRTNLTLTADDVDALLVGATEQGSLGDFARSRSNDRWSDRIPDARGQAESARLSELEAKKDAIKDKLQFLRANRLQEQEKQAIEEFRAIAPADPQVRKELESYEMQKAREVLARRVPLEAASAEDLLRRAERLTPEQEASKSLLVERTKELAKKVPRSAYDLALSLHFMDFNAEALEVLSVSAPSPAVDWLRLELMIHARMYVDALDLSSTLEARYASDPEAAFAITYARARSLKGLGQGELATDLLRSLVRVRPTYKSAQSLLMDWSGGDE